jgi:homocysteine S-methyltransferase
VPVRILPGLLPLASLKQALYLHNEVPGMSLPQDLLARLQDLEKREDQMALGVDLARSLLASLRSLAPGAYLTAGGRKAAALAEVLQELA